MACSPHPRCATGSSLPPRDRLTAPGVMASGHPGLPDNRLDGPTAPVDPA